MRVVKSVSLPVQLAEKAEELPNFSLYVQNCLDYGIENAVNVLQRQRDSYKRRAKEDQQTIQKIVALYDKKWKHKRFYELVSAILQEDEWIVLHMGERTRELGQEAKEVEE
jgi:hypothetical protein